MGTNIVATGAAQLRTSHRAHHSPLHRLRDCCSSDSTLALLHSINPSHTIAKGLEGLSHNCDSRCVCALVNGGKWKMRQLLKSVFDVSKRRMKHSPKSVS